MGECSVTDHKEHIPTGARQSRTTRRHPAERRQQRRVARRPEAVAQARGGGARDDAGATSAAAAGRGDGDGGDEEEEGKRKHREEGKKQDTRCKYPTTPPGGDADSHGCHRSLLLGMIQAGYACKEHTKVQQGEELIIFDTPQRVGAECMQLFLSTEEEDYIANAPIRTNVTESQPRVALTLDIGVLDTTTCKPLSNLWGPNAVGEYGSTFLRGATKTGETLGLSEISRLLTYPIPSAMNGIAEFQTIFPGYTTGSVNHLNILVHPPLRKRPEFRTSASSSSWIPGLRFVDIIGQYTNYNKNTNTRIRNTVDPSFVAANKNRFNSIVDIDPRRLARG
ncbi:hypothetical protein B0H14DRAFT_2573542 [Mycena olivaceomarginata]|nr:hypothetical protein B0H14DRAFT_2573542 [Mycena olivaceomarginata]